MSLEVLIVEDEDDVREILVDTVASFFTKIHEARNGQEGLQILSHTKPALIITDFNMPKLNGVEFIKMIKSKYKDIPIIVLTGRGSQEVRRLVWAYGIWEYFEKPFDPKELRECIQNVIFLPPAEESKTFEKPLRLVNFEEVTVLLEKKHYVPFLDYCLNIGRSPNTMIEELIIKFTEDLPKISQLKQVPNNSVNFVHTTKSKT